MYSARVIQVLQAAEHALRQIIGEALDAKAYRDVATLANAANTVAALSLNLAEPGGVSKTTMTPTADVHQVIGGVSAAPALHPSVPTPTGRSSSAATRRGVYPRFFRDGDRLVKVAWSKKERRTYEHRAPQEIVATLIEVIKKRKGEGKIFDADDILPLTNSNGENYPSYQSYLALAWLRDVGVVIKKGRDGYILKPGTAQREALARLLLALSTQD